MKKRLDISAIPSNEPFLIKQGYLSYGMMEDEEEDMHLVTSQVIGDVGILRIRGVLCNHGDFFDLFFGHCPIDVVKDDFKLLVENASVRHILLDIDSPGGSVSGVQNLAKLIWEARARKNIIALANGQAASGAYWIASAAQQIFLASPTAMVGSIGVITFHVDVSERDKQKGVKITEIFRGQFKNIASENKPLSDEGQTELQRIVDLVYEQFVQEVAKARGLSIDFVTEVMANAQMHLGAGAVERRFADGIKSLEEILAMLKGEERPMEIKEKPPTSSSPAIPPDEPKRPAEPVEVKKSSVNIDDWKTQNPELHAQLVSQAMTQGSERERQRILDIESVAVPGFEQVVAAAKKDQTMTAEKLSMQILRESKDKGVSLTALQSENHLISSRPAASQGDLEKNLEKRLIQSMVNSGLKSLGREVKNA